MIILPKEITVSYRTFKVVFPYHFKERADLYAQTDYPSDEIRISDIDDRGVKLSEQVIKELLIHEILHIIDYIYNGKHELTEEANTRMSNGLTQVLMDSQGLITLFTP